MKSYITDLLPRLQKYSARLDNLSLFTDHPWVQIDDSGNRTVFIFRKEGNELLISQNGEVGTSTWEYLDYMNSLLVEIGDKCRLYNQGFLDDSVMILRQDGQQDYLLLVNENKINPNNPEQIFARLNQKYLSAPTAADTPSSSAIDPHPSEDVRRDSKHSDHNKRVELDAEQEFQEARLIVYFAVLLFSVIALFAVLASG